MRPLISKGEQCDQWSLPKLNLCDLDLGVHKAPERTVLLGALGVLWVLVCMGKFHIFRDNQPENLSTIKHGKMPHLRAKISSNSTTHAPPIPLIGGEWVWGITLIVALVLLGMGHNIDSHISPGGYGA